MILNKIRALFSRKKESAKTSIKTGTIKFFNRKKGFGFIQSSQTPEDVYVHVKDANDRIYKGARVQFEVEKSEKGLRAKNVVVVKKANSES